MPLTTCPDEIDLFPLVAGESAEADLDEHLKSCDACRGRLKKLKARVATMRLAAEDSMKSPGIVAEARNAEIPRQIGQYDIVELLDEGGQAQVLRAFHRALRQEVVIKLGLEPVPPDEADADGIVNEARLLRTLEHPHLARVYDLDFHNHRPVLVMEFIRGRSLFQLVKERVFTSREAADLIAKVSRAAGAAHRIGVYHRDITPRNILIDEDEQPRLIDFGLARLRSAWGEKHEPLGLIAGTRLFMSPEQAAGRSAQVDSRSDVYGLGQVLKYMLADRSDPLSEQLKLRSDVPPRLAQAIERATAVEPGRRFGSADELAAALERSVRPRWPREWVALAAIFVIAAAVGVMLSLWPKPRPVSLPQVEMVSFADGRALAAKWLPLDADARVRISTAVPHGWSPLLLLISPDSKIETFPILGMVAGTRSDMDEYRSTNQLLIGRDTPNGIPNPRGIKLVLVVATPKPLSEGQIADLSAKIRSALKGAWSPPDDGVHSAFAISNQGLQLLGLTRGAVIDQLPPLDQKVQDQLEAVRRKLNEADIEFFAGVAFPYDPTAPTSHTKPSGPE